MLLSEHWLREWVNPSCSTHEVADTLTGLGLEVDALYPVCPEFTNVVVAKVVALEPHPNANRLRVCSVLADAQKVPVSVVCGAANVHVGAMVAFAQIGAQLPGGFTIKAAQLRGVESFGMLCSAAELGLEEQSEGILLLPADAADVIGADFREYAHLNDVVIDIELTPNRGDCASVQGLAREISAKFNSPLQLPSYQTITPTLSEIPAVEVQARQQCPHYALRLITQLDNTQSTPFWLKERLRRVGARSVNPIVDCANYVMFELGQPLHTFDADKIKGALRVQQLAADTTVTLVNGQDTLIPKNTLVIQDERGVQAIAGVMGVKHSAVTDVTQKILVESAYFDSATITAQARSLGLHSDASYRFERGVDPSLPVPAIERFTALLHTICPQARCSIVIEENQPSHLPVQSVIALESSTLERILGVALDNTEVEKMLCALNMTVKVTDDGWEVVPPSYRFDVNEAVDLIEEIARFIGYDRLAIEDPTPNDRRRLHEGWVAQLALPQQAALAARGYMQTITYSFVDPLVQQYFISDAQQKAAWNLVNPMGSDLSQMRLSLWPGLIQALRYNLNRQAKSVRLFECGLCFVPTATGINQPRKIAGVLAGQVQAPHWLRTQRDYDFFDLKADVDYYLTEMKHTGIDWQASEHPALHPGQAAAIYLNQVCIGHAGRLHPKVAAALELSVTPFVFELDWAALVAPAKEVAMPISKFPAVRRDLAIVIDKTVTAAAIVSVIKKTAGPLLTEWTIFDIYEGEGIDSEQKSVALSLTFLDSERTLSDKDINHIIEQLIKDLSTSLNARMRA